MYNLGGDARTVEMSWPDVQRSIMCPMLTRTVSAIGVAGTNSPARVRNCKKMNN